MPDHAPAPAPFDPWRSADVAIDVTLARHAGAAGLAARQSERLARLLDAAARGSKLYRGVLHGRDAASCRLDRLPVMRKAALMKRFDDWVTDPQLRLPALRRFIADPALLAAAHLGRYTVWESSGSSGEPGIFVQDAQAMAVYDALEALRRPQASAWQWLQEAWGMGDRVAFVGAAGGHFASMVSFERLRRLNPALAQRLSVVSFLQPVADIVAQLDAIAPTVIATYPTAAVLLAQERMAGRLRAAPHALWTGGEDLSPAMRAFVARAFDGCPVVNSYGASEFLALACECERGALHLNSDWVILEPVDDAGRAVPAGQVGATTLLTNLANHVQPLIRYDLNDRVLVHEAPCACGSPLPVIQVQGRSDDILRLAGAGGGAHRISVLPLAVVEVLEQQAGLFDFQLVQCGPRELLLRSGLAGSQAGPTLRRAREALGAFLQSQGACGVRIRCRSGELGQLGRSGKIQRILALDHGNE